MEMTKMLLPTVPSMGKIHSNDKYDKRFLYRDLTEFRDSIFLSRLETGKFLKVVRESLLIENLDLLHFPYYESQRNARPSANEEYRYDNPTTPNEKKTEIQSNLQCQSKPEPQPEPEPKPEQKPQPELKPISNPEIEPEIEPETEIESESELRLPEWETPLNKKQKLGLDSIPVWDYDSDDDMITIGQMCKMYDSDDEFAKRTSPNDANSKPTSTISEKIKQCKEKLKNVFIRREIGGNCMWPIMGKYQPIKRCYPVNYQYEMSNVQHRRCNTRTTLTRNLSNRSLLKSQRNVNNTFSPTNTRENLLPSNNQEKKLCDQNQDYQRKIAMPYTQQAIDSQEAEIKQLLSSSSDDDLMDTDTEVDEMPVFRHDHINVHEKLNEYLSEGASTIRSLPRNEEPTQRVKRYWRKNEENQRQIEDNIMRNTLSDHCYHLNQPRSMERLELSDSSSDEEIDVVSYERQITQQNDSETTQHNAAQTTQNIPQASQHNIPQATSHNVPQTKRNTICRANQDANENNSPAARRPRGRPPGPNSAKRRKTGQTNQTPDLAPTSSSSRVQNHQRTERRQNSTSSRQNRNDNEKSKRRSLHNDMERMRRDGLKQMFALVHKSIPAIKNNEKASKLAILEHARTYIYSLQDVQSSLKHEKARLEEYNQRLLKRLKCAKRVSSFPRKY